MMKHTGSLALGLGLFLGLPAFTFGGGLPDSVSSALDDTVKALEVLGQLKDDLEAGNPVAQGLVESMTEAPSGTSQGRDQLLTKLRDEVSGLQSQLDTRRLREGVAVPSTSGQNPDGVTTGRFRIFSGLSRHSCGYRKLIGNRSRPSTLSDTCKPPIAVCTTSWISCTLIM